MRYLHTMIRIENIDRALDFFCDGLGFKEVSREDSEAGRYTNLFLSADEDMATAKAVKAPMLELTFNWDKETYQGGRNFGHIAIEVDDIYGLCEHLAAKEIVINRPPRDGHMAFVRSPEGISIELLQKGKALAPAEPWLSMGNIGHW